MKLDSAKAYSAIFNAIEGDLNDAKHKRVSQNDRSRHYMLLIDATDKAITAHLGTTPPPCINALVAATHAAGTESYRTAIRHITDAIEIAQRKATAKTISKDSKRQPRSPRP